MGEPLPNPSPTGVIAAGYSFQWLLAWSHCVRALLCDEGDPAAVTAVGIEADDANPFDDIVLYRRSAPDTYIQAKYTVDARTPVNTAYLANRSRPGGRSLLEKAARRWVRWARDGGHAIEVVLTTNRVADPNDPLLSGWDARTGLLVRAEENIGPSSAKGLALANWAEAAAITADELLDLLAHWRFELGRDVPLLEEQTMLLMYKAGLQSDETALQLGISWIVDTVVARQRSLSIEMIANAVESLQLRRTPAPVSVRGWERTHVANQIARRRDSIGGELVSDDFVTRLYGAVEIDWRDGMLSAVNRITKALKSVGESHDELDSLNWQDPSQSIATALRRINFDLVAKSLSNGGAWNSDIRDSVNLLERESRNPHFGVCVPILGTWGAGKSRTLCELASRQSNRDELVIFLDAPSRKGTLEIQLLSSAAALLGTAVPTLKDLVDILHAGRRRLLICIDDIDRLDSDDVTSLQELIATLTICNGLRWVLTADALRYDRMTGGDKSSFWPTYGMWSPIDRSEPWMVAGWVDLDVANEQNRTGLRILERQASEEQRRDLELVKADPGAFGDTLRLLLSPLPAWVQSKSLSEGIDRLVVDIHRKSFIASYWEILCSTIADDRENAERLEALITFWARAIFKPNDLEVPFDLLVGLTADELSSRGFDDSLVRHLARNLADAGVVRIRADGDPEIESVTYALRPTHDVLWGYRIARTAIADANRAVDASIALTDSLQTWGLKAQTGDALSESVASFGLSLLPWDGEDDTKKSLDVWNAWVFNPSLSDLPLQIASLESPEISEQVVINGLAKKPTGIERSKREIFVLMRFIAKARSSSWTAEHRLAQLQPYYAKLGDAGLGHYCAYLTESIMRRQDLTSPGNIVECLTNLCGTEDARFAAIAADEAVECVYRLHDDGTDGWLEPITAFLKLSLRKSLFPPRPPMEKRRRPDVDLSLGMQATGDTYRFWEHVIQRAIRRLVRQLGVDAFSSLLSAGWLGNGPPMSREVHARIRTELNVALGANFRSNWHDELEVTKFLSLLEDLIAGTALPSDVVEQRMRAFFMIRHTEVTGRNPGVSVDHRLLDALGQLCNDPKLIGPLGRWRTPMMEANGLA